ncbi:hypothetical protein CYLTODRAFT_318759, partial [Cylindrobasidium torrendii FP15055 ss-10]
IPPELKDIALELWEKGWGIGDIVSILHVSRSSIYRWYQLLTLHGTTRPQPAPLRGRPRIITLLLLDALYDLYRNHPQTYLDEAQWHLAIHHDINISISALQETLERAGLTRRILHKIAGERDELQRQEWRTALTDPETFSGTEADHVEFWSRGQRYSLIAALSTEGYLAAKVVPGSFNTQLFFSFIVDDVLPHMNPYPNPKSVLIMDNCRIHHTELLLDACN